MWGVGECPRFRPAEQGFTLIEMLVTLGILALVMGIAYPSVEKAIRQQDFRNACARIEGFLRSARAMAAREGRRVEVRVSADRHRVTTGMQSEPFAPTTVVTLPVEGLSFFPDGSVRGGAVSVQDRGLVCRWTIQPATGAILRMP